METRKKVILFGSGYMAEEYLKVLQSFGCDVLVIGRNTDRAVALAAKYGAKGFGGSTDALNGIRVDELDLVIIASAVESLSQVSCVCLERGAKNILLEKPGALDLAELQKIAKVIKPNQKLGIEYNRRFYNSVIDLKKKIQEDGGLLGCFFDFTDREKDILCSPNAKEVVRRWGFGNSSHVIDTVFHLIGFPLEMTALRDGSWDCHPSGNVFVGVGKTKNCLFSYFSTWAGGGRWDVEISTDKGRYKLSPMEELQFCQKNQFAWEQVKPTDDDDKKFKPGLYKIVKQVLFDNSFDNLPAIEEQIRFCAIINKIFGYEN